MISSLAEFRTINAGMAHLRVVWDALKAFFRGTLIQHVARVKRQTKEWEKLIMNKLQKGNTVYSKINP